MSPESTLHEMGHHDTMVPYLSDFDFDRTVVKHVAIRFATHVYVYTQHHDYPAALTEMIRDAAEGGFEGVEIFLRDLEPADQRQLLSDTLKEHGVTLIGASVNAELWDREKMSSEFLSSIDRQTDYLAELGGTLLGLATLPQPGRPKTAEEYDFQADMIDRINGMIRPKGIEIAYHTYEADGHDDCKEIAELTKRLSPEQLRLGPDLCWLFRGGADPAQFVRTYKDRIDFLHVRDERDAVWSEVIGQGAIDWHDVGAAIKEMNFSGWICVELADTANVRYEKSLKQRHEESRRFLQDLWGI